LSGHHPDNTLNPPWKQKVYKVYSLECNVPAESAPISIILLGIYSILIQTIKHKDRLFRGKSVEVEIHHPECKCTDNTRYVLTSTAGNLRPEATAAALTCSHILLGANNLHADIHCSGGTKPGCMW